MEHQDPPDEPCPFHDARTSWEEKEEAWDDIPIETQDEDASTTLQQRRRAAVIIELKDLHRQLDQSSDTIS